ncbi:MAG: malto-oligosyltrehalose synthase [Thermodesulfobacteriota bacterium]
MRIPAASYRVQFNPSFGFREAKKIVPYLAELGISDLYASPIFKARTGSLHGYDVVDPNQLNPQLGNKSHFGQLMMALRTHGMGWLQDIVPNHMAFDYQNQMLVDVLENGQSSQYFHFFDIEWDHPYESIKRRVLAPFLGRFYGESLEEGEIKLRYVKNGFILGYYNRILPLRLESYVHLLTYRLHMLKKKLGADHPDYIKLLGILYILKTLPSREEMNDRYDQIRFIKTTLWELYQKNEDIRKFIRENIKIFNGKRGNPESFNLLNDLLSEQLFRLSFWKVATEEINYRRFFNINEFLSLRIEDEDVFNHTHSLAFKLIEEGKITGLRIDHIDGLYDPTNYLKRIRQKAGELYVLVEKILDLEEELPSLWPVQGTTGYEFLNYVNGLFCKREHEKELSRIYTNFTALNTPYEELVCEKKRLILGKHMAGDVDNLAHFMKAISSRDRHGSDITIYGLKRALVEVMTQFPVYRTYIGNEISRQTDRSYIKEAIERAKGSSPGLLNELQFIERFLLLDFGHYLSEEEKNQWTQFVMRFQQFTGPLMAKGFEDTTLYVYNRLLSLNEVGGNPNKFGISTGEFHHFLEERANPWPHSFNATSTHDTKRGEDTRARINVLSEIPREWEKTIKTWSKANRERKRKVRGRTVPDRNDEYFLYQTLLGAFPFREDDSYQIFQERMKEYIIKAVREAKVHTAWLKPDTDYENAFISFLEEILSLKEENTFLKEFLPFHRKVCHYGIFNSLSQTLVKITAPGVPDFYQGTELWDLTLVDPDNRRPVDFERRRALLREIRKKENSNVLNLIEELLRAREDGRIKLFLIYRALKTRNEHIEVFRDGAYIPLEVAGKFKDHIFAFARKNGRKWTVTVAPRFLTTVVREDEYPCGEKIWHDTHIPCSGRVSHEWKNVITRQQVNSVGKLMIGEVLRHFPVALLMREETT